MKAVVLARYGSPDVLAVREIPRPELKYNEVLVKVHATAVNDWDWSFLRGKPYIYRLLFGLFRPKVSVLGIELAGTVEAVGRLASKFRPGDRVYGDVSEAGFGGFAEYACVRENALHQMPAGMSFEQASALPHAGLLALQGLVDLGKIQRGERVLINGAGGGVGAIGLQIAKEYGCEVTGVDRDFKLGSLKALGFDHVIDYQREDFTSGERQYDMVLDVKTTRSPIRYLHALRPGGRYVTVGGHWPRLLQVFLMGSLLAKRMGKRLQVLALKPNQGLDRINRMFESQSLKCPIDGPYRLEDVPEALRRFGEAGHIGKIVIAVA